MNKPWQDETTLIEFAEQAKVEYVKGLDPVSGRERWHAALDAVGRDFKHKLQAAFQDGNLEKVIADSGAVMELLRQLTAPPLSQDQFKLLCPSWPKGSEKPGKKVKPAVAKQVATVIRRWIDPRIIEGLEADRLAEVAAGPLYILARQKFETEKRTQASRLQESGVTSLLDNLGFTKVQSREIDQPWTVGEENYMHKTTFRSASRDTAEVDIAVGLPGGRLLAIECKVSNDATNSIKRVNDVLKKRESWEKMYGNVLTTGAVMSGVIMPRDILRLSSAGVCVFFSHDLAPLRKYLVTKKL